MNWYKQYIMSQQKFIPTGWITTFEKVAPQPGQKSTGHVFNSQRAAESEANRAATIYNNRSKGNAGVMPAKITGEYRRTISGYEGTYIVTGPFQSTEKSQLNADKNTYVILYELSSYTYGSHGGGEWEERPASTATTSVDWQTSIPEQLHQKYDEILMGASVIVAGHEEGSYHERWFKGAVVVAITPEQENALIQINTNHSSTNISSALNDRGGRFLPIEGKFQYESWNSVISSAAQQLGINGPEQEKPEPIIENDATQPKPGQTPESYYEKQIEIERARQRKPGDISGD